MITLAYLSRSGREQKHKETRSRLVFDTEIDSFACSSNNNNILTCSQFWYRGDLYGAARGEVTFASKIIVETGVTK